MNIEDIKCSLLVKYPLFGSIIANTGFIEKEDVSRACTDGENIYYNSEFIKSVDPDQRVFVFAHEICHIAFDHIFRSEGRDKEAWNIATDAVINASLERDGLPLIPGIVNIPGAIGYDADELYNVILKNKELQAQDGPFPDDKAKTINDANGNQESFSRQKIGQKNGGTSNGKGNDSNYDTSQNSSDKDDTLNKDSSMSNGDSSKESSDKSDSSDNDSSMNNGNSSRDSDTSKDFSDKNDSLDKDSSMSNGDSSKESSDKSDSSDNDSSMNNGNSSGDENASKESSDDLNNKQGSSTSVFDDHSIWEKAVENKHQRENEKNTGTKNAKEQHNPSKDKSVEVASQLGETKAFEENRKEKKQLLDNLRDTSILESHGYGTSGMSSKRIVSNVGAATSIVDWRMLLRESILHNIDWSLRNAEIENGVVSSKLEKVLTPDTEIVLDTSGSVNEERLRNFLRECKGMMPSSKIRVGCFDTDFYGFRDIRTEEDINDFEFVGGGGTDFDVAVGAFTRTTENKIIFTDGLAPMPIMPINATWVVYGNNQINPPGGRVIYVDDKHYLFNTSNSEKSKTK